MFTDVGRGSISGCGARFCFWRAEIRQSTDTSRLPRPCDLFAGCFRNRDWGHLPVEATGGRVNLASATQNAHCYCKLGFARFAGSSEAVYSSAVTSIGLQADAVETRYASVSRSPVAICMSKLRTVSRLSMCLLIYQIGFLSTAKGMVR